MISSIFLAVALQQQTLHRSAPGVLSAGSAAEQKVHRVAPGETLSAIAPRMSEAWQQLYLNNKSVIGDNPNLIYVGEVLHAGPAVTARATEQVTALAAPARTAPSGPANLGLTPPPPPPPAQTVSYSGSGAMQSCIIARESGGDSQVMNASGHYGLYQFSASTWAASGGNPADFGNASVAEQNRVFANAVAARGYSDWTPYDGCL